MPWRKRAPLVRRLGVRLMAAVGIALLPLSILAYLQAERVDKESQARAEAALFGETLLAAAPQMDTIRRAQGMAAAMAEAITPLLDSPEACTASMRELVRNEPTLSLALVVPLNGQITCASTGENYDVAGNLRLQQNVEGDRPVMYVNPRGSISKASVLIFSHPVRDDAGNLQAFVSLSAPHHALTSAPATRAEAGNGATADPLALVTFDREGTVLSSQGDIEDVEGSLPADTSLVELVDRGAVTFRGVTNDGERRIFALVPMIEGTIYVLSSWPPAAAGGLFGSSGPTWVFPVGMWLASMFVAWIAAETQVLRHIRALRRSIISFASGSRTVELPDLDSAPAELADVGDAYERMVEAVLHDEAALEDTVHQKEVLLREVHHRVKNNLQLIASIMNIQMRKAANAETRNVIKGLHDRVMSLATVHRELYQTSGLADVRADELLTMIVAQVLRMGSAPGRALKVETQFDLIRLTPDQSVPLSLILTEALTNVLKHAGRNAAGDILLDVSLKRTTEGWAMLRVANSMPDVEMTHPPGMESSGLGEQLLSAFAMQLGGKLSVGEEGDTGNYIVTIEFPLNALTEAEERFVAAT